MDRHDAPGVTPEELADLHMRDVEVQERHRVRYHTYWFDPANGSVFCLAEGPTRQALEAVHEEAHGQLAGTIIEPVGVVTDRKSTRLNSSHLGISYAVFC